MTGLPTRIYAPLDIPEKKNHSNEPIARNPKGICLNMIFRSTSHSLLLTKWTFLYWIIYPLISTITIFFTEKNNLNIK